MADTTAPESTLFSYYTPGETPEAKPQKSFLEETAAAIPRIVGGVGESVGKTLRGLNIMSRGGAIATQQAIPEALKTGGEAAQNWGQKVQQEFEISPETRLAHPNFAQAAGVVEKVASTLPLLAIGSIPVVGQAVLPAAFGAEQFQNSYETGLQHGMSEQDAAHAAMTPALVSAAGMAAMGPVGELAGGAVQGAAKVAGDVVNKTITQSLKEYSAGALADAGMMVGQTAAVSEAEKATGIRPEAQPIKEAFSPESLISAVAMGGAFRGVATLKNIKGMAGMRKVMENPEAPIPQRMAVAAHIESQIRKTDPKAADEFGSAAKDAILGETPSAISMGGEQAKAAAVDIHDKITEALHDSVTTGKDLTQAIQEKTAPPVVTPAWEALAARAEQLQQNPLSATPGEIQTLQAQMRDAGETPVSEKQVLDAGGNAIVRRSYPDLFALPGEPKPVAEAPRIIMPPEMKAPYNPETGPFETRPNPPEGEGTYKVPADGSTFVGPDGVTYTDAASFGDYFTGSPVEGGPTKRFNVTELGGKKNAPETGIKRGDEIVQLPGAGAVPEKEGAYRNEPPTGVEGKGTETGGGNRPVEGETGKITVGETRPAGEPGSTMRVTREVDPTYGDVLKYHDEKTGETLAVAEVKPDGTVGKISDAPGTKLEERTQARKEFAKATSVEAPEAKLSIKNPDMEVENKTTYQGERKSSTMGPNDEHLVAKGANGKDAGRLWLTKVDGGFEVRKVEVAKDAQRQGVAERLYAEAVDKYGIWKGSTAQSAEGKALVDSLKVKHPEWFGEKPVEAKAQEPAQIMTDLLKTVFGQDATFTREEPKGDAAVAAKALSSAIGKEFVILRQKPGEKSVSFSGAVWPQHPDYIFAIAGSKNMMLSTTLHESVHTLRMDHPDLYAQLVENLKPFLKNLDAREIQLNAARKKAGYKPLKPEMILEERIAELMGDQAVKPAFWDKLMAKSPGVVQRIYEVVKKIVDSLVEAFKNKVPNQDVANAIKVRDILADHLGEYIKRTEEAKVPKTPQEYAQQYDMAASLRESLKPYVPITEATPESYAKFAITPQDVAKSLKDNKFIEDDLKPGLVRAVVAVKDIGDGIKKGVAPGYRTKDASKVQEQFREVLGHMWQKQYQAGAKMDALVKELRGEVSTVGSIMDTMRSQGKTLADNYFAKLPDEQKIDFIFRMQKEGPEGMTDPVQRAIGMFMKDMNDARVRAIQDLDTGLLGHINAAEGGNDNHFFAQYWKKPDEAQKAIMIAISKRPIEGQKSFARARVFEDVHAGLELGYELVSTNPVDLFFMKMGEMDKYIAAHTMLQGMEKQGLATLRPSDEFLPAGETNVLGTFGTVKRRNEAPESWTATGLKDDQGNPTYRDEKGKIQIADFKSYKYGVHEDVAQVINNYLSPTLYNNKYIGTGFTGYMNMANHLNQFQLGVGSFFHAGFTTGETVVTHVSLGMKAISNGDLAKGLKYIVTAPAEVYKNPMRGDQILSEWANPGSVPNANVRNMPLIIEGLRSAGVRKEMDTRFQTHATESMLNAWANGNKTGAAVRAPFAMVEQMARPIMEWLVPRQKFGVFGEMFNYWLDEHPNSSAADRRQAAGEIWNRVDSRLGQVNYDRLFVNNTAKNLLQASLRAPGWTGGTILELGGGFKDLGELFKNIATGKKPNMSDRTAYTLALVVTTAVTNGILTTLFTGEQPEGDDFLAFRTGNTDEHGFAERFMLPSYMKDMYAYWNDTTGTLGAKIHPAIGIIKNVAQNKDYYGTEIRHEGDNIAAQFSQLLGFGVKQFVPFWVRGVQKEQERGGSALATTLPFVGIMPASAELNRTPAEKAIRKFLVDRTPSMTKTTVELDRGKLVSKLTRQMRAGDPGADSAVQDAVDAGEISTRAASQIRKDSQMTPLEVGFKRLSLDEATTVMEKADPDEKAILAPLLEKKQTSQKKLFPNGIAGAEVQ